MPLRCCVQYTSKFGQLNSAHRTRKVQSSFQSLRRAVSKKVQTTTQLCSFHKLVKLCSKFFKLGFKKHEMRPSRCTSWVLTRKETRDQIANICWIKEKAREFQKNIYFCFINYAKAFDCIDHKKLWKFLQEMEYQMTLPVSWEICMQIKKQQLELDMEQLTGSKLGKEYIEALYCHPAYLTYMQSTSREMPG